MGMPDAANLFLTHRVTGRVLSLVGRDDLFEMGIRVIGHRLGILREISRLRDAAMTAKRNIVLFETNEYQPGPCGDTLPYGFPCCCCSPPPEQYILYDSKLQIKLKKPAFVCCGSLCGRTLCGTVTIKNNIPLEAISDVDSIHAVPCACDRFQVNQASIAITVQGKAGLNTRSGLRHPYAVGITAGSVASSPWSLVFDACCGTHIKGAGVAANELAPYGAPPRISTHRVILRVNGSELSIVRDGVIAAAQSYSSLLTLKYAFNLARNFAPKFNERIPTANTQAGTTQ